MTGALTLFAPADRRWGRLGDRVYVVTLGAFLAGWLDSHRVRPNTLDGYRAALKPVTDHLGTVPLQHLDTPHPDELVTLRPTSEPIPQRAKRGHRSAEVLVYLRSHPDGARYSELLTTFGEPGIKALDRLMSSGDVLRPQRSASPRAALFFAVPKTALGPAMNLRVYGHVYKDALAAAGWALLGGSATASGENG